MRTSPEMAAYPTVLLDGVLAATVTRRLEELLVHTDDDGSRAAVRAHDLRLDEINPPAVPGRTRVEVRHGRELLLVGTLGRVERVAPESAAPSVVLHAAGPPVGPTARTPLPLHHGNELLACSVQQEVDRTTARGTATVVSVRCGCVVDLSSGDPALDGRFTVRETWHRFDTTRGVRVEFVAEA